MSTPTLPSSFLASGRAALRDRKAVDEGLAGRDPLALSKYGIGLEDVRAALAAANAHSPKGAIEDGDRRLQIYTNDKANHAEDYRPLVIAYRDGAAVRLSDVAEVEDSVENVRAIGLATASPQLWSSFAGNRVPTSSTPWSA